MPTNILLPTIKRFQKLLNTTGSLLKERWKQNMNLIKLLNQMYINIFAASIQ